MRKLLIFTTKENVWWNTQVNSDLIAAVLQLLRDIAQFKSPFMIQQELTGLMR